MRRKVMVRVEHRKLDVLQRRRARQEIESLEHEADFLIADVGELIAIQLRNVHAVQVIAAARWMVEAAEDVH